jgi:hypothetical protein
MSARRIRAEKYGEGLQAEIEAKHFACWRIELRHPELYPALDDDDLLSPTHPTIPRTFLLRVGWPGG